LSFYFSAGEYGLFLADEDPRKGIWLENGRTLDYYLLRSGVSLQCFLGILCSEKK
jgi:talin